MATYPSRLTARIQCVFAIALAFACGSPAVSQDDATEAPSLEQVEFVMDSDPKFEFPVREVEVSGKPIPLWIEALSRPDPVLQRAVVDTIAIAHRREMIGIGTARPHLVELLKRPDLNAEVRAATIRALIEFEAKDLAPLLVEQSEQYGMPISALIEPAIIRWKSPLLVEAWKARLDDPGSHKLLLRTAIEGLGALGNATAAERLGEFVTNVALPTNIRIASAKALGQIRPTGLEPKAETLIKESKGRIIDDLLAIRMLNRHDSEETIGLLRLLLERPSTAIQSEALNRLYQINRTLVLDHVEALVDSPDANVRRTLATAMIEAESDQWIPTLAALLDDVNPSLRRDVAEALFQFAQNPELRPTVISEATGVLDQDAWRGCEQAALILVNLDHQESGDRLVDLMRHPRGEVMHTAGWGLQRFGQRRHLPAMLGRANEIYDGFKKGELAESTPGVANLQAQLFLAFGQLKYSEADELMQAYLPKNYTLGERPRAAAAWAMGYLYENQQPDALVNQLISRIKEMSAMEPEYESVGGMSAISLGRMNAQAALPILRANAPRNFTATPYHWALEKLTGEKPPETPPRPRLDYNDWFLRPLEEQLE